MKKAHFSLSWKLTLCSMAAMLVTWAVFGAALVLTTAQEILDGLDTQAELTAEALADDSFLQAVPGFRREGEPAYSYGWMMKAAEYHDELPFPRANDDPGSRYTVYSAAGPFLSTEQQSDVLYASTFIGIQVGQLEEEPWNSGYLLFLDDFSFEDLHAMSRQLDDYAKGHGGALPRLSATGRQPSSQNRGLQVDTITIGDRTYHSAHGGTQGQDSFLCGDGREQLDAGSYALYPQGLDLQGWRMLDHVRQQPTGQTVDPPPQLEGWSGRSYDAPKGLWEAYSVKLASYHDQEGHDQQFQAYLDGVDQADLEAYMDSHPYRTDCSRCLDIHVWYMATPLKTALGEHGAVLALTLLLVPVLGALLALVVRRMVAAPLKRTSQDFSKVARLDFDALSPPSQRRDEIGDLDRDLRSMADELQRRWDDERALERRRQDFVAAASHDLKTPLALMRGYTEGLQQGIGRREQYLDAMEREIARMDGLVLDMLDQTRLERMEGLSQLEDVDLSALLGQLTAQMAPLFQGLQTSWDIARDAALPGDRRLLERAFSALLTNAAQYTAPGGQVHLTLTIQEGHPRFVLQNQADPIPPEDLPRLTEMFFRGDGARDRAGSGMGLAIAQKIFALHHLSLQVENVPGGVQVTVEPEG